MDERIEDVMTPNPTTIPASATVTAAARAMRDHDIGDVVVLEDSRPCGIVTDRDLVVRAVAAGKDPASTLVADICSRELATVSRKDSLEDARRVMREHALRRVPVVDDGTLIGIVSIGDLAALHDPDSALGIISAAAPNR